MIPLSIIIPTLNEERYLPTLLGSLIRCTFKEIEIIVVDGKSEDKTLEVVKEFQRKAPPTMKIKSVTSPIRNVSEQRNLGVKEATHELLIFFDADVVVPSPERLRELISRFQLKNCAAASCRFTPMEPDIRGMFYFAILYLFHKAMERIYPYALGACIVTTKEVWRKTGGFDPTIRINEDANFVLKAKRFGGVRILPVTLEVSSRRFKKHGYFRMGIDYMRIFFYRTFRGEIRDKKIPYTFGHYGE